MSRWTHSICDRCYAEHEPGRDPVRIVEDDASVCCFCGKWNKDGIYYRFDPSKLKCEHRNES